MPRKPPSRTEHSEQVSDWENEGGAPQLVRPNDRDKPVSLGDEEEHIMRRLGSAVIAQWNDLPTDTQRKLFRHAISEDPLRHSTQLKEQIARFLHDHKK